MKAASLAIAVLLCTAAPVFARRALLDNDNGDMSSVTYEFSPSSPSPSSPSESSDLSPSPSSPSPSSDSSPSSESSYTPSSPDSSPSPSSGDSSPSPSSPSPTNYSPSPSSIATVAEETPAAGSSPPSKKSAVATSANGCQTALGYLKANDDFSMLIRLINATPKTAHLAEILDSPDVAISLLAPNNYGINRTLDHNGLSFTELLADPVLVLEVLQYHMLPNTIPYDQLQNGYSFNTLLPGQNFQDSVTVANGGDGVTIRGAKNDAKMIDTGTSTCLSMVFTLSEMLLPKASVEAAAPVGDSATEAAADAPALPEAAAPDDVSGVIVPKKVVRAPVHAALHAPAHAPVIAPVHALAHAPALAPAAVVHRLAGVPAHAPAAHVVAKAPVATVHAPAIHALAPAGLVQAAAKGAVATKSVTP